MLEMAASPAGRATIMDYIYAFLKSRLMASHLAEPLAVLISVAVVLVVCAVATFVLRRVVLISVKRLIQRSTVKWDDLFLKWRFFDRLFLLIPLLLTYALLLPVLRGYPALVLFCQRVLEMSMIFVGILVVDALLNTVLDIYQTFSRSQAFPLKSLVQILKITTYSIGLILFVAVLADKTPLYLLSGMGALTAVLMLVFKDSILGFVAGIQLSRNQMVMLGDWIEMPKYNADGSVIDIALTTVKVRNWDNTVTMIPAYTLISDSFKNWRYMAESGGRRIKRSIFIDVSSIRFCTEEMLQRFEKIAYISDYVTAKQREIKLYNETTKADLTSRVNGRRLTNIGMLRAYLEAYLRNHPMINQSLAVMVRQLAPTEHGLPLEIYAFCSDKRWIKYEAIQSDIFDHALAVVPEFDLRIFQQPSGHDWERALNHEIEHPSL